MNRRPSSSSNTAAKPSPSAEAKAESLIAVKAIDEHTRCPTTAPCPVHLHDGPVVLDRQVWRDSSDDSKDCHVADRIHTQPQAQSASASVGVRGRLSVASRLCASTAVCTAASWTGEGKVPWFILNHEEIGVMQLIGVPPADRNRAT